MRDGIRRAADQWDQCRNRHQWVVHREARRVELVSSRLEAGLRLSGGTPGQLVSSLDKSRSATCDVAGRAQRHVHRDGHHVSEATPEHEGHRQEPMLGDQLTNPASGDPDPTTTTQCLQRRLGEVPAVEKVGTCFYLGVRSGLRPLISPVGSALVRSDRSGEPSRGRLPRLTSMLIAPRPDSVAKPIRRRRLTSMLIAPRPDSVAKPIRRRRLTSMLIAPRPDSVAKPIRGRRLTSMLIAPRPDSVAKPIRGKVVRDGHRQRRTT